MAKNSDGTVVLRTTGKVASTPKGSGAGKTSAVAVGAPVRSTPGVKRQAGRRVVPRKQGS